MQIWVYKRYGRASTLIKYSKVPFCTRCRSLVVSQLLLITFCKSQSLLVGKFNCLNHLLLTAIFACCLLQKPLAQNSLIPCYKNYLLIVTSGFGNEWFLQQVVSITSLFETNNKWIYNKLWVTDEQRVTPNKWKAAPCISVVFQELIE